jgi:hypothetical protein
MFAALEGALVPLQNGGGGGGAAALLIFVVPLLIAVVAIAGFWKAFAKAGEPGWAAIIPIYNVWVMARIGDSGTLWFVLAILFGIPLVKITIDVAKKFGQGAGFGIGLFLLAFIFWPLLGFGDYEFQGQAAA